jgi:hypothetical protein
MLKINQIRWIALVAICLVASGANADTLVAQMLGQSEAVGSAYDVDAREGTDINFARWQDDPTDFACFEMPLIDPSSGTQIGTGVDCLRFDDTAFFPDQIGVTAYSFFVTPGGTLVNRGKTSLRALIPDFGDGGAPQRTHATGSIPSPSDKTLVAGTGLFDKAKGRARVSGAVNPSLATPFFDCLWKIEVD